MIWLQTAVLLLAAPSAGGDAVLLDFYSDQCMPCRQMAPTIDQLASQGYPVRKINAAHDPATATRYGVRGLPTFILVSGGREIDRAVGRVSYDRLAQMFRKAEAIKARAAAANAPSKMPARMPSASGEPTEGALPMVASGPISTGQLGGLVPVSAAGGPSSDEPSTRWAPLSRPTNDGGGAVRPASYATKGPAETTGPRPGPSVSSPVSNAELIASTVRLRIQDAGGQSGGTGTIIDARDGWALVLTCGHLFRDSKGKGRIDVELFGPDGPQQVAGEMVAYDSERRDLGFVRIRVPGPVRVAPVAPRGYNIEVGAPVASVGCSKGADPTVIRTRIRAKNKFVGPPNIQADGLPVEGRSGGGLFSAEGYVIGVCNAADPTDNAGLYAALESIQDELDRTELAYIYRRPSGVPRDRWSPLSIASQGELVAVQPPGMPAKMPAPSVLAETPQTGPVPTSSRQQAPQGLVPRVTQGNLTPEEIAALEEIRRRKAEGAEVICIIRSPNDPSGKSEILRLGRASNAFLEQLNIEAGTARR